MMSRRRCCSAVRGRYVCVNLPFALEQVTTEAGNKAQAHQSCPADRMLLPSSPMLGKPTPALICERSPLSIDP